ncbi:methionine synthase [Chloroflexota bacterium]
MTDRYYTNRRYLDALQERVLVFDGAMGTSLQTQELTPEQYGGEELDGCNDYLVISYPQAVEQVHRSFLEAGVDVLETDTFRANRITMAEYGLEDRILEINQTAAALARKLADEYSDEGKPRFVAGSIGPSGQLPSTEDPELSRFGFDELVEVFREQAEGLVLGGCDLVLIETSQDILEVKAAIVGIQNAFEKTGIYLPIQAQVTLDTSGRMLLGTDITTAITILENLPIDVIGLNCSTGPEHMRESIRILGERSTLPISCIPNAGLPLNVDGKAVYPLEPTPFADAMTEFVEKNHISVVGGCCGTTPEHMQTLVDQLKDRKAPARTAFTEPRLSSSIQSFEMHQDPPPLLIGERCNAQGSRKFKRLLLNEDYDAILEIARKQVEFGAHALDISTAVTERPDEEDLMRRVVKKLSLGVEVPLVIDTTELDVLETALKTAPGRCLVNSTHFEGGTNKAAKIFDLAKKFNAAVIVLTIDESGMAKTAQAKLDIARRIHDFAVETHGLPAEALVFDALTFTLATGEEEFLNSAIETIEGIRLIKQSIPGSLTSLGVSNLSFGLSPQSRPVLNSVMLYHCVRAGLDMAIINPAHITAYADISQQEIGLAEDLIFNRRPDALSRYITFFEDKEIETDQIENPTEGMTPAERLNWSIVHRHKDGVEADIDKIVLSTPDHHLKAVETLNTVLLPAMKEVGDKFGAGELILPFVLQSAEVMKKAVTHLETYLERVEGVSKGTVVLATVYGDVHDIGKNLVKTILSNNGFRVVDLGKQVPAETIIASAVEENAAAIGLSALLVSTSKQMPLIINELDRRGLHIPVLLGGAAINRRFGRRVLFTERGSIYSPGVFYCKDAFEGLETMESLIDDSRRSSVLEKIKSDAEMEMRRTNKTPDQENTGRRSDIEAQPIKMPENLGSHVVTDIPLESIFQYLNINELYRLSWGAKNTRGSEWEELKGKFDSRLESMKKQALSEGWLNPRAVYGFYPCHSDGDELVIYDPASIPDEPVELMRMGFPRQPYDKHLCLADYFSSKGSNILDVVAFQVVTVGEKATERFDALQDSGDFSEAYFIHGLAVQTAEATAEYLHRHIRRMLGIKENQGKRYSWGYPAIPDLDDHRKVFDLVPAEKELGMSLSSAFQLIPEQSTAAIIVHHPQARYYTVGESRIEQLMK